MFKKNTIIALKTTYKTTHKTALSGNSRYVETGQNRLFLCKRLDFSVKMVQNKLS